MFGLDIIGGDGQAIKTVGLVFAEAIALYVGYGALTSTVGSAVVDAIGGD